MNSNPEISTWLTRTIGAIQPNVTYPLYAQVIAAIGSRTYEAGYSMILCDSAFDPQREQGHLELLLRQGVSGIVIIPVDPTAEHVWEFLDHNI